MKKNKHTYLLGASVIAEEACGWGNVAQLKCIKLQCRIDTLYKFHGANREVFVRCAATVRRGLLGGLSSVVAVFEIVIHFQVLAWFLFSERLPRHVIEALVKSRPGIFKEVEPN